MDEWDSAPNQYAHMSHQPEDMFGRTAGDAAFQKAIEESMKHARGGTNVEEELLQKALEESLRN
jgi:hypothetical protein